MIWHKLQKLHMDPQTPVAQLLDVVFSVFKEPVEGQKRTADIASGIASALNSARKIQGQLVKKSFCFKCKKSGHWA